MRIVVGDLVRAHASDAMILEFAHTWPDGIEIDRKSLSEARAWGKPISLLLEVDPILKKKYRDRVFDLEVERSSQKFDAFAAMVSQLPKDVTFVTATATSEFKIYIGKLEKIHEQYLIDMNSILQELILKEWGQIRH